MERVILITTPQDRARPLARALVERRLAACINIVPALTSVYWWEGSVMEDGEALLVVKTTVEKLAELETTVKSLHPYEVPEFVVLKPDYVEERYRQWLHGSL